MKRFKINKKLEALALITTLGLTALTGCGTNKTTAETTEQKGIYLSQEEYDNLVNSTETTAEEEVEVTTEDEFVDGELNINSNASIENIVDTTYDTYQEFYDFYGISKDQIRDMIFVVNDKYTDEEGNLVIDEDRAYEAYANIKTIIGQSDDSILQKIDNINTINYAIENPNDETLQSIAEEVKSSNDWKLLNYPTLTTFVDKNISGGAATIDELNKWEAERNHQVEVMNANNSYDRESINNYVIEQEITNYNNKTDNMNKVDRNGQKFIIACVKFTSLNIAAKENNETIYLEGYDAIDQNIKINPTNEERFLENDVITLVQEGLIDANLSDSIIAESKSYIKSGYAVDEIEELLHEKYTVDSANLRLIVSYAHYLTTMANDKYLDVECDEQAETYDDIGIKRKDTSSLINPTKNIVLC